MPSSVAQDPLNRTTQMGATNLARREEPYTVSSYVRECVRQQLQKNERGRRPYGRRLVSREERECREMDFDQSWGRLSEQGACDSLGGCEYTRVRAEWIKAGRPEPVAFIRRRQRLFVRRVASRPRSPASPALSGERRAGLFQCPSSRGTRGKSHSRRARFLPVIPD